MPQLNDTILLCDVWSMLRGFRIEAAARRKEEQLGGGPAVAASRAVGPLEAFS
jgi:hypothetical protein